MKRAGVSIFFVSHSIEAVRSLCNRALWIERGHLRADGPADEVTQQYMGWVSGQLPAEVALQDNTEARFGNRKVEILAVRLLDEHGEESRLFRTGQPLEVAIDYQVRQPVRNAVFGLAVHRIDGVHVCGPNTSSTGLRLPAETGRGTVTYRVPYLPLLDGYYHLSLAITDSADTEFYDHFDRAFSFRVANGRGGFPEHYGLMTLRGEWQHTSV
jgi:lipopolysaccharide transport system ATP-binding protein